MYNKSILFAVDGDLPIVLEGNFESSEEFRKAIQHFRKSIEQTVKTTCIAFNHCNGGDVPSVLITGKIVGLCGGKGGFGAQLRSLAKQKGLRQTRDFGACRDLSGRRLRSVNHEIILAKWKEAQEKGEAFNADQETPTGINLWFMAAPAWADIVKETKSKKFLKTRFKTSICTDWQTARMNRAAPPGAPLHWGCPRGARCEFAHGETDLRGSSKEEAEYLKQESNREKARQAKEAYLAPLLNHGETLAEITDTVAEGLRAIKRSKIQPPPSSKVDTEADEVSLSQNNGVNKLGARVASGSVIANLSPDGVGLIGDSSQFGSIVIESFCCDNAGEYYYETDLSTDGLMQIGWSDRNFLPSQSAQEDGDGVGDCASSWAYDGMRQIVLHSGEEKRYSFGPISDTFSWQEGDTLGCWLKIAPLGDDSAEQIMRVQMGFVLQGTGPNDGIAFEFTRPLEDCCFFPAISLEKGESLVVNTQQRPFLFRDIAVAIPAARAITQTSSTVAASQPSDGTEGSQIAVTAYAEITDADLAAAESVEDLLHFGMDALKNILTRKGVKCGGTHLERATRLFAIRSLSPDQIDVKLRANVKK